MSSDKLSLVPGRNNFPVNYTYLYAFEVCKSCPPNDSAGICSISLRFRTDFDHMMLDAPQTFKVNGSKVKVTAWHNASASKNAIIQARERSDSVRINLIAEGYTLHVVQGHKVKYWNRNHFTTDCSVAFKFGTGFHDSSQAIHCKYSRSEVEGQGHRVRGHSVK